MVTYPSRHVSDTNGFTKYTAGPMQLTWALSVAVSLLSSRYLILDLGFHYPFCIHLLQVIPTILWGVLVLSWSYLESCLTWLPRGRLESSFQRTRQPPILMLLSNTLLLQAVLHLPNLTILAMIPVLCYCVEQMTTWLTNPINSSSQQKGYLLLLLYLSCATLIYSDNRLSTIGLACAVLAALVSGLAESFSTHICANLAPVSFSVDALIPGTCGVALLCLGVLFKEPDSLVAIGDLPVKWLLTNIISSALSIAIGGSILTPNDLVWTDGPILTPLLALVGFTGCVSAMVQERSYTTVAQLVSYGAAIVAIGWLYAVERKTEHRKLSNCPTCSTVPWPIAIQDPTEGGAKAVCSLFSCNTPRCIRVYFSLWPLLWRVFGIVLIVTAWVVFLCKNFVPEDRETAPIMLDYMFQPNITTEVVISMYQEPTESVASLITSLQRIPDFTRAHIHVYIKDETVNTTALQAETGAHQVTLLPNVGRESETYLNHILSHWDVLAKHTLFVQAIAHNEDELFWRIRTSFDPLRTGMLDLGFRGHSVRCRESGSDRWGWRDQEDLISRTYDSIHHAQCYRVLLSYKGQFLVSAQRIRGISKNVYRGLHEALLDPESWAHQEPFLQNQPDAMTAPAFGYTVERLWNILFQCSDVSMEWRCSSFLSRKSAAANQGKCQCLDL